MKKSFKAVSNIALLCTYALITGNAAANVAKSERQAEQITKQRQAVFSLLGANMGPLGAMAKGKIPVDAERVKKHALRLKQLSMMIVDHNKTDTSGFNVNTSALKKVWQNPDDFSDKADSLTQAASALEKTAMAGNAAEIKKAIGKVGKTCGSCHDDYKKK